MRKNLNTFNKSQAFIYEFTKYIFYWFCCNWKKMYLILYSWISWNSSVFFIPWVMNVYKIYTIIDYGLFYWRSIIIDIISENDFRISWYRFHDERWKYFEWDMFLVVLDCVKGK